MELDLGIRCQKKKKALSETYHWVCVIKSIENDRQIRDRLQGSVSDPCEDAFVATVYDLMGDDMSVIESMRGKSYSFCSDDEVLEQCRKQVAEDGHASIAKTC